MVFGRMRFTCRRCVAVGVWNYAINIMISKYLNRNFWRELCVKMRVKYGCGKNMSFMSEYLREFYRKEPFGIGWVGASG
jgi:hypothetical protein